MDAVFTRQDLSGLIGKDWQLVVGRWVTPDVAGRLLTIGDDGLKLTDPYAVDIAIWKASTPKKPVLPFPFTLEEFKAFCEWHPTFQWEAVESVFKNDDGSPDEAALSDLESRNPASAVLVRGILGIADAEYLRAWEIHQSIDQCKADIAEANAIKPATFTEINIREEWLALLNDKLQNQLRQLNGNTQPQAVTVEAALVVEAQSSEPIQTTSGPKFIMSKAGLMEAHRHEWPTIEGDLKDASTNGLSNAKAKLRGWNEATALQWARAKGKLIVTTKPTNELAKFFTARATSQAENTR